MLDAEHPGGFVARHDLVRLGVGGVLDGHVVVVVVVVGEGGVEAGVVGGV